MKPGDVVLTPLPQADAMIKNRPAVPSALISLLTEGNEDNEGRQIKIAGFVSFVAFCKKFACRARLLAKTFEVAERRRININYKLSSVFFRTNQPGRRPRRKISKIFKKSLDAIWRFAPKGCSPMMCARVHAT